MILAIFDLDHTLLEGDSDYLWGQFLVNQGILDSSDYERANERFYQEYQAGTLNINEFLSFSLQPLRILPRSRLNILRERFILEQIIPIMRPLGCQLIAAHQQLGHLVLIITATNAFVTAPIAQKFGVDHLIATLPEEHAGEYTGNFVGIPVFRAGKITSLKNWCVIQGIDLNQDKIISYFYSDSHNDLPLLEFVTCPVAIDPDPQLRTFALARAWPILSLMLASDGKAESEYITQLSLSNLSR